jgi:uncharacterized membrane protein
MCMSSRTYCYLLTGALAGLVVACVLDDIHIYDMYCYLLTGALAGLVVACVLDDTYHICVCHQEHKLPLIH